MKFNKKVAVVMATSALAVAGSGVAYSFFSGGSGSGDGTATTGAKPATSVTTNATLHTGAVTYDGSDSAIDITVTNSHPYSISWSNSLVQLALTNALPTGCPAGSFVVTGSGTGKGGTVGPATTTGGVTTDGTQTIDSGYSIHFVNSTGSNQDTCAGDAVNLASSVS